MQHQFTATTKATRRRYPLVRKEWGWRKAVGCLRNEVLQDTVKVFSGPSCHKTAIKISGTSIVDAVQWWRPDNWAKLRDNIQMAHCLGGC